MSYKSKKRMNTLSTIKHFNPFKNARFRFRLGPEVFKLNVLGLQSMVEAFHWSVVPAITLTTHTPYHAVSPEPPLLGFGSVLASAIGMMNQAWRWSASFDSHIERTE
ncbi:MAG: hypothetical protein EOP04_31470 [Proteobacteria bacterium]|nr:MAG: hypothetical protein EOP04_31470 [Pseudomonadota bacterium]